MNVRSDKPSLATSVARPIYLDHHSTTPVDRRVAEVMVQVMTEKFGNPSNRSHFYGEQAADLIEQSRIEIGRLVDADPESVVLIRSTTTAADAVISRLAAGRTHDRPLRVVSTTVEHAAVLDVLERYARDGRVAIRWLAVDKSARIDLAEVSAQLEHETDLICVMASNNEVGTIYPVATIAEMAGVKGVPLLVDATQAAGHIPLSVREWGVSYLLMAAHKMYGPKGAAALVASAAALGEFRHVERAEGTPNVPAIAGFGEACRLCRIEMTRESDRVGKLRDRLQELLLEKIDGLVVNGDCSNRLAGNLHVSVGGIPNEAVVARLSRTVALSTGSACRWGTDETSHVLRAMGLSDDLVEGALRLGLGRQTTLDDVELAAELIAAAVNDTRHAVRGR
jgi:cysteine desulfurase